MPMPSRIRPALLASALLLATASVTASDPQQPRTIIVMDGSGSMWGQIDGRPKLEIARETVADVVGKLPANQTLGLIAYGHRRKGDCKDIELIVPPAPGTSGKVLNAVNDPFLPRRALPGPNEVSAAVTLDQPREGGHVGFVTGSLPGRLDWLPQRVISFLRMNR